LSTIRIGTAINTRGISRGLNDATKYLNKFQKGVLGLGNKITRSTSGIVDNFARIGLAVQGVKTVFNGLKSLVSVPLSLAAGAESTATSFEVMTGSVAVATKLIKDLKVMGASTPFEFVNLSGATETLLAFSRPVEEVLEDLDMLSNIASGNAEKLKSLN